MADEPQDVKSEISLDDFNADEQQPAKAAPSPAPKEVKATEDKTEAKEIKTDKTADTAAPPDVPLKEEGEAEEAPADTEDKPTEDKPPTEAQKPTKADDRKAQLNSEIRDLVSQRNTLRAEVEKANGEVYQPASVDELTEQGMTELEAKVEAMRQASEMERYNNQVAEAQLTIGHESQRVLNDFPMFNPEHESFDKELSEEAAELLSANLIIDPNTEQVIGSNVSPYQLYKTLARASTASAVKGQLKGQTDTEKQLANVDAASNTAPPSKPQTAEQKLIDMWKTDD